MTKLVRDDSTGEEFTDIWEAIEDSPEEAATMRARSDLMSQILLIIHQNKWADGEAATHCGLSLGRMKHLLNGHITEFDFETLLHVTATLGRRVRIEIEAA